MTHIMRYFVFVLLITMVVGGCDNPVEPEEGGGIDTRQGLVFGDIELSPKRAFYAPNPNLPITIKSGPIGLPGVFVSSVFLRDPAGTERSVTTIDDGYEYVLEPTVEDMGTWAICARRSDGTVECREFEIPIVTDVFVFWGYLEYGGPNDGIWLWHAPTGRTDFLTTCRLPLFNGEEFGGPMHYDIHPKGTEVICPYRSELRVTDIYGEETRVWIPAGTYGGDHPLLASYSPSGDKVAWTTFTFEEFRGNRYPQLFTASRDGNTAPTQHTFGDRCEGYQSGDEGCLIGPALFLDFASETEVFSGGSYLGYVQPGCTNGVDCYGDSVIFKHTLGSGYEAFVREPYPFRMTAAETNPDLAQVIMSGLDWSDIHHGVPKNIMFNLESGQPEAGKRILPGVEIGSPSWSPDGSEFIGHTGQEVIRYSAEGAEIARYQKPFGTSGIFRYIHSWSIAGQ